MRKKKHEIETYNQAFNVQKATYSLIPEECDKRILDMINHDITNIVFSCALQCGWTSIPIEDLDFEPMRGGWRRVIYRLNESQHSEICVLGPIKKEHEEKDDSISFKVSFDWYKC